MARATTSKKANASDTPSAVATTPERRVRKTDRRKELDRRAFPPRAEGRRVLGGRRKGDPLDP